MRRRWAAIVLPAAKLEVPPELGQGVVLELGELARIEPAACRRVLAAARVRIAELARAAGAPRRRRRTTRKGKSDE